MLNNKENYKVKKGPNSLIARLFLQNKGFNFWVLLNASIQLQHGYLPLTKYIKS
jgi:hypothetical protein